MAASRKIRIMISSRCNDSFPLAAKGTQLLRARIVKAIANEFAKKD